MRLPTEARERSTPGPYPGPSLSTAYAPPRTDHIRLPAASVSRVGSSASSFHWQGKTQEPSMLWETTGPPSLFTSLSLCFHALFLRVGRLPSTRGGSQRETSSLEAAPWRPPAAGGIRNLESQHLLPQVRRDSREMGCPAVAFVHVCGSGSRCVAFVRSDRTGCTLVHEEIVRVLPTAFRNVSLFWTRLVLLPSSAALLVAISLLRRRKPEMDLTLRYQCCRGASRRNCAYTGVGEFFDGCLRLCGVGKGRREDARSVYPFEWRERLL